MTRGGAWAAIASSAVVLCLAVVAVRVARHYPAVAAELGRTKIAQPTGATRDRLRRLDSEVLLSWVATRASEMPPHLRTLEADVMGCLRALEAVAPDRIRIQRIDPDEDRSLAPYLAAQGIAPFRARRVERDAYTEESVWSSLRIAYGPHGAATIARVGPTELEHLQALIVAHLDELEHPRRPRVGLSAPAECAGLRRALSALADVQEIDFDADATLGPDLDLLLWIDPKRALPAHLAALDGFLARGRSAIIAGSRLTAERGTSGTASGVRFAESGAATDALLPHFGLSPVPGIALDGRSDEGLAAARGEMPTYLVRAIGPNQDFRTFGQQPNGSLWFAAPTMFEPDAARLAEMDLECTVLATSSEATWTIADTRAAIPLASLQPQVGETAFLGRRALLAILRPIEPWRGSIVFAAAPTPFIDPYFAQEGAAHEALMAILCGHLASGDRRAAERVALEMPPPLAAPTRTQRTLWRALVVFGLSALVLACVHGVRMWRHVRRPRRTPALARALAVPSIAAVVGVCALARFVPESLQFDWTRERVHEIAPATRAALAQATAEGPVALELVFSAPERLPPELRPRVRAARELALQLKRAASNLALTSIEPEVGIPEEDARAAASGVVPSRVTSHTDEVTTVRRIYSAITLTRGTRRELLNLPDAASFDDLEFRVACALERLAGRPRTRVAIASDVPRPAPAESLIRYQRQGLFAPSEGDVYSQARDWLAAHDFEVTYVDARDPHIPPGTDLVVWLQPRREIVPMARAALRYLSNGGKLLLAAQHFQVRSRQESDNSLALTLWPEPQFPDVDRLYFPRIGIEFPREVLFDASSGTAALATEVEHAIGRREIDRQTSANPLLVRAVAANFDRDSAITRGLSDQLFLFGNRIVWDDAKLAEYAINARPLIWSSARTWSYAWSGGDLPPEVLRGPPENTYLGRQALAVEFEGAFPNPAGDPALADSEQHPSEPVNSAPGALVWIGCSEMFKNDRLHVAGFDHAALLLRAAAHLALGDALTSTLSRERADPGFEPVGNGARTAWRAIVLCAAPLLLACLAVVRGRMLRRAAPIALLTPTATAGTRLRGS